MPNGWTAFAQRFPNWVFHALSYLLVVLIGAATVLLIWGGIRIVVLNQGFYGGPSAGVFSFGPIIKEAQLEKLKTLAEFVEIDEKRICFFKPPIWKGRICFEDRNVTAFDGDRASRQLVGSLQTNWGGEPSSEHGSASKPVQDVEMDPATHPGTAKNAECQSGQYMIGLYSTANWDQGAIWGFKIRCTPVNVSSLPPRIE